MTVKNKFTNIFGEGAAEDFWSAAPTLSSVLPSLVDTSAQGMFSSVELNRRAEGVRGGRKTRAARTRSASQFLPQQVAERMQNTTIFDDQGGRGPEVGADTTPGETIANYGADQSVGYGTMPGSQEGRDEMLNQPGGAMQQEGNDIMGNEVLGTIGSSLGTNAAMMTAGGLAMGGTLGNVLPSALGQSVAGMFAPMSMLNTADNLIGSHLALEDAKLGAQNFPEEQQVDVMQGMYQTQPQSLSGRLLANFGMGDQGVTSERAGEMSNNNYDSSFGRTSASMIDQGMNPDQVLDNTSFETVDQGMNTMNMQEMGPQGTQIDLNQGIRDFNQPGMVESLMGNLGINFEAPDDAGVAGAGVEMTQGMAPNADQQAMNPGTGSLMNNVSDQYTASGTDPFGEGTYSKNINEPDPVGSGAIEATPADVTPSQPGPGIVETPANVVDTQKQSIADNLEAEKLAASTTASDAARAKEAADKAASEKAASDSKAESARVSGLQSEYKSAQDRYASAKKSMDERNRTMSSKTRDNHGAARLSAAGQKAQADMARLGAQFANESNADLQALATTTASVDLVAQAVVAETTPVQVQDLAVDVVENERLPQETTADEVEYNKEEITYGNV